MTRTGIKNVFIFILLAGMMSGGGRGFCQAADPVVLTVRPEMLRSSPKPLTTVEKLKNIFAWPVREAHQEGIEELKAEELAQQAFDLLHLDAILWHKTNPQAIINGRLVAQGEEIDTVRVEEIHKDSILLKKEGFLYTLVFEEQSIILGPDEPPAPGKISTTTSP